MTGHSNSHSENRSISLADRLRYFGYLLGLHLKKLRSPSDFSPFLEDLDLYKRTYESLTSLDLRNASILEIGFGQRPFRHIVMTSAGYNVRGLDLDQPLAVLNTRNLARLFKKNGPIRGLKSLFRALAFDPAEYKKLHQFLKSKMDAEMRIRENWLFTGDASSQLVWQRLEEKFEFIYSEDVFEHIPGERLEDVVKNMHNHMSESGIALISPVIFTGICGGHEPEWYPESVNNTGNKHGVAWGHLTGESRPADTYLNRWTREQYRSLFSKYFVIKSEIAVDPDLGRKYLTSERRARLTEYDEDELFSNKVRFTLQKCAAAA